MSRIPEPDHTPDGPAYEGRLLDRADEEVVDQGVAFDLRTLVTRRGVLSLFTIGAAGLTLAACAGPAASTVAATGEIPDETAGPYL